MNRPKILQISDSLILSGGAFQLLELTKGMIKKGYDVTITCCPESQIKEKAIELNIKHIELPLRRENDVVSMYMLYKFLKNEKYDVVHAHHPKAHTIAMVSCFFAHTPVFVVSRRVSFSVQKPVLGSLKYTFPRVDMILPVCESISDLLVSEGVPKTKLRTIYSGTDHERFNPETVQSRIRQELGIKDDEIVITKIAHYSLRKGYDCFFEAAKLLLSYGNQNVKFIIAGEKTSSEEVIKKIKNMGLENNIYALGPRKDIPEILKVTDIAVNTAYEGEGLSGFLREALFMGVPIVAADVSGNKEICIDGKTGYLFVKKDAVALTNILINLIKNKDLRQKLGSFGRNYALTKGLTVSAMVTKTLEVYKEVLERNS